MFDRLDLLVIRWTADLLIGSSIDWLIDWLFLLEVELDDQTAFLEMLWRNFTLFYYFTMR